MPDQKISAGPKKVIKEQVFNEDRKEGTAQLERQAQVAANAANEALEAKRKKRKLAIEAKKKKDEERKKQKKR